MLHWEIPIAISTEGTIHQSIFLFTWVSWSCLRVSAQIVLQAMRMRVHHLFQSSWQPASASLYISSHDLSPYGAF